MQSRIDVSVVFDEPGLHMRTVMGPEEEEERVVATTSWTEDGLERRDEAMGLSLSRIDLHRAGR